jgi:outer membrane receptor for ferric coprogen and ferric-rhodotorulic acid
LKDAGNGDERTYLPKQTVTLLGEVDVVRVDGLSLAVSMRWQDEVHYTSQNTATLVRQPAYTVLGFNASYDFSDRLSLALNLDNITDETYLNSLYWADIYAWDQAFYGEPRNVTLRVSYDF